jgi:hypothetical protein
MLHQLLEKHGCLSDFILEDGLDFAESLDVVPNMRQKVDSRP